MDNLTNPALLFFVLGIIATQVKSDLKIPESSSKFISMYLLLSIGFKGGQELSHSPISNEMILSLLFGLSIAMLIPVFAFQILRRKLSIDNSGAIAAAYGSVSAVTFVTAISFLQFKSIDFDAHMIAVMALMEAPAIIAGILLIKYFKKEKTSEASLGTIIKHSITNGSVLIIIGSLLIGFVASEQQAEGIKPFTTDIFKGFLAVFLLDMGLSSGKHLNIMLKRGAFPFLFSAIMPFINGTAAVLVASSFTQSHGNLLLFGLLAASASYIAVPAAMKNAVPKASPGLYLPMALGITFPINVVIGIPYYDYFIANFIL